MSISFDIMTTLSWLGVFLLIGFILRAKLGFFQRFFVPACITGGVIGLVLRELHIINLNIDVLQGLAYHVFNITFISLGLTRSEGKIGGGRKRDVIIMGLLLASTASLQFFVGGSLVYIFNLLRFHLHPNFGFLLTMGFDEGPGQALSVGLKWEDMGFQHASTIGLSFAAIGFLFAIFVGTPLASWVIKRGYAEGKEKVLDCFVRGYYSYEEKREPAGKLTTHSSTIDSLTFHFSLIALVYILTYGFILSLSYILPKDLADMYWGFFFIWGLLIAYIVRWVIDKIGVGYLLDSGVQSRITGWGVDILVTASISAISIAVVWEYIIPISVISIVGGVLTLIWIFYLGRKLWRTAIYERICGLYGMETGTIATGVMLVRVVDPKFKTPAAVDLAISGVVALPIMYAMMHIMLGPLMWKWSLGFTILVYLIFLLGTTLPLFAIDRIY